jgi:hypothetical protein
MFANLPIIVGDAPKSLGFCRQNRDFASQFFSRFFSDKTISDPITIAENIDDDLRQCILWAVEVASANAIEPVIVVWLRHDVGQSPTLFIQRLRQCLVRALFLLTSATGEFRAEAIGFDLIARTNEGLETLFANEIYPILELFYGCRFVVVTEWYNWLGSGEVAPPARMLQRMFERQSSINRVQLIWFRSLSRPRVLPRLAGASKAKVRKSYLDNDLATVTRPLILLCHPASLPVVRYLSAAAPTFGAISEHLISNKDLVRLQDDALALDVTRIEHLFEAQELTHATTARLRTIIPNTGMILSGAPFSQFVKPEADDLKVAEEMPGFPGLLSAGALGIVCASSRNVHLANSFCSLANEKADELEEMVLDQPQAKIMINYLSQFLLLPKTGYLHNLFQLLERLSSALATEIKINNLGHTQNEIEAMRWLTKVAYVYDQLVLQGKTEKNSAFVGQMHGRSARLLDLDSADDSCDWAVIGYRKAAALYRGNGRAEVRELYVSLIKRFFDLASPMEVARLRQLFELTALCIARDPQRASHDPVVLKAIALLRCRLGILLDQEILVSLFAGRLSRRLSYPDNLRAPQYSVYFSHFDAGSAFVIAESLYGLTGANVQLVPISAAQGRSPLVANPGINCHIVIGAPDSEGGAGDFVAREFPDLVRLYQLRMGDEFGLTLDTERDGLRLVVIVASGLGQIVEAWSKWLARATLELPQRIEQMEEFILNSLLSPVLKGASKAVEAIVNNVIKQKLESLFGSGPQSTQYGRRVSELLEYLRTTKATRKETVKRILTEDMSTAERAFIRDVFSDEGAILVLKNTVTALATKVAATEDLRALVKGMLELCAGFLHRPQLGTGVRDDIIRYQGSFRGFSSELDILDKDALVAGTVTAPAKLADLGNRIFNSSSSFMNFIKAELAAEPGPS